MTHPEALIFFLIVALVTVFTRAAAFLLFPEGRRTPRVVEYLGRVLPFTMIGLLVVYCLKEVNLFSSPFGLPELIGVVVTAGLHLWQKNIFLSIAAGTIVYMVLVQLVFC